MSKLFWLGEQQADSRRERRKLEFRDKILEAAIELFETQGCDVTTLDDICRVADVSRPTFYKHYATKQELILELGQKELSCTEASQAIGRLYSDNVRASELTARLLRVGEIINC